MRIALAQLNYHIGDFENNIAKIISYIHKAKSLNADIVLFSELAICGYPPRDFLEFNDFIIKSQYGVLSVARESKTIAVIVGAPSVNPSGKGKPLYNSAYFLVGGKIKAVFHKTLLPNYDVFDEYRYFEPNRMPYSLAGYKRQKFAVTICEDLWNIADDPLYVRNPMDELTRLHPGFGINIAASPFHYDQPKLRREVLVRNAKKYNLPFFYLNHVGGQTELLFDGGSMVVDAKGNIFDEMKYFEEDFRVYDLDDVNKKQKIHRKVDAKTLSKIELNREDVKTPGKIELIHDALVMGIKDYFGKMGLKTAILGLSGGIDSAVTLVLAARALGSENVLAILLPSRFSSEHSKKDAIELADRINVKYDIIKIDEAYAAFEDLLNPWFKELPFNLTEENIQARARAVILMALSNKFGYILLNTSNKSEAAVGYGTLYGDMCGGISVLGDVYKSQVYELAAYINRKKEIIPQNSIDKPPSAELRPGQKDSDSLPDYSLLDKILYEYIELRKGPNELIREGFDEAIVKRVLKLVNTSEYKRNQTPPILRVSPKAFGTGRRMPIVGKYLS
jgi:NAD+ synthase (glutamine-hydrolysing)